MAAADWFRRKDGSMGAGKEQEDSVEFKPEAFKKDMDESLDAKLKTLQEENDKKMKPLLDMATSIAEEKAEKAKKLKEAEDKKTKEENEISDEDWMLDPKGTAERLIAQRTQGTNTATLMLASRMALKETFEDAEQYPYYTGDVKAKVDAMVDAQPLNTRHRSDVIQNCYKLVVFDHQKEIAEGKIKARNSAASLTSTGTGGPSGKGGSGEDEALSNEEKFAAKSMGITEDDWKKSKRELTYV